ncbi:MAG: hypothetical protein EOO75_08995, partial [Myxococcales bacterium]
MHSLALRSFTLLSLVGLLHCGIDTDGSFDGSLVAGSGGSLTGGSGGAAGSLNPGGSPSVGGAGNAGS